MAGEPARSSKDYWKPVQLLVSTLRLAFEVFRWFNDDDPGPRL